MKILAICGSIRKESSNWALLKFAESRLSEHEWVFTDLTKLPYFEPEEQFGEHTPQIVMELRESASTADLIFIATPEYAHGIPGILKNALEWLFCEGTMKKQVALIIGSGQGIHVKDQLIEVLSTMDFLIDSNTTLIIKGARHTIGDENKKLIESFLMGLNKKLESARQ